MATPERTYADLQTGTEAAVVLSTQGRLQPAAPDQTDALMRVIERAVFSPEFDVAKLKELLDVRDRLEKTEARKQFVAAMSAFKAHAIVVTRDKVNKQFGSRYTSIGNLVGTVTPYLSQHNLSASWDIDQGDPNQIRIVCTIEHEAGHSRSVSILLPPDVSGSKNPLQEIKSAITYGKICTFESICGLASVEGNSDDDGNGKPQVEASVIEKNCEEMAHAKDHSALKFLFTVAYDKARDLGDRKAMQHYITAKDKRKKELDHATN
jgi:ERF superfamily